MNRRGRRKQQMSLESIHKVLFIRAKWIDMWLDNQRSIFSIEELEEDEDYLLNLRRLEKIKAQIRSIEEEHQKMNELGIKNRIIANANRKA